MKFPMIWALLIVFILWLQFEIRKNNKKSRIASDNFWERENSSNLTRRKDISDLNLITINTELLPMEDKEDPTINFNRDAVLKLTDKKICNLTGITNTELKSRYGASNISLLSEYDNNFTLLISSLHKWAESLYEAGWLFDAQAVLEYAVDCKTDVNKTYKLLAEIYKQQKTPDKIDGLIQTVSAYNIHDKDKLLQELQAIMLS